MIVYDTSSSVGLRNWERAVELTLQLSDQLAQPVYAAGLSAAPGRSRIGLITSVAGPDGSEPFLQLALTADMTGVEGAIRSVVFGGDIDILPGLLLALSELQASAVPDHAQAIALMLNERDALVRTPAELVAAADAARAANITLFIIANNVNVEEDERITQADVALVTIGEALHIDPTTEGVRRLFVQATGGDPEAAGLYFHIEDSFAPTDAVEILPGSLSGPNGQVEGTVVRWDVPRLGQAETVMFGYQFRVTAAQTYSTTVTLAGIDCNGYLHSQFVETQTVTLSAVLPTPLPTSALARPSATSVRPTNTAPPPTAVPIVGAPHPPGWASIEALVQSVVQMLAPAAGASAAAGAGLPIWLEWGLWLIGLVLLLLLVWFLWRLIRWLLAWWRRRGLKPPPLPATAPVPPPTPVEAIVPAWLTRLDGPHVLASAIIADSVPAQDTLIIGLGPAGRQVLTDVARTLNHRQFGPLPDNVRLLQVDVQALPTEEVLTPPAGLGVQQWVVLRCDYGRVEASLRNRPADWPHWAWYDRARPTYDRARGRMALFADLQNGSEQSLLWRQISDAWKHLTRNPVVRVVGTTFDDTSSGMLVDMVHLVQLVAGSHVDVQLWLMGPVGVAWSGKVISPRQLVSPAEQKARSLATLRELARFQRNSRSAPVPFNYVPAQHPQEEFRRPEADAVVQTVFLFAPPIAAGAANTPPEGGVLAVMADALVALVEPEAHQALTQLLKTSQAPTFEKINADSAGRMGVVAALGVCALRTPVQALEEALAARLTRDLLFDQAVGLLPLETSSADGSYTETAGAETDSAEVARQRRQEADVFVSQHRAQLSGPRYLAGVAVRLNDLLNGEASGKYPWGHAGGLQRAEAWLTAVQGALRRVGQEPAARRLRESLSVRIDAWTQLLRAEVKNAAQVRLTEARDRLNALTDETGRQWAVEAGGEWPAYRRQVRGWDDQPHRDDDPVLRGVARFGWQVSVTPAGAWEVRLLVPPPDAVWTAHVDMSSWGVAPDVESVLARLTQIAAPLVRLPAEAYNLSRLLEAWPPHLWLERASVRLDYDQPDATLRMSGVREAGWLLAPSGVVPAGLMDGLRGAVGAPASLGLHKSALPGMLILMRATDWLPLESVGIYAETAWRANPVRPALHVWSGEQLAAEIEIGGERLAPRLVAWLESQPELLGQLGAGYLMGVVHPVAGGRWAVPGWSELSATSVEQAFTRVLGPTGPDIQFIDRDRAFNDLRGAVLQAQAGFDTSQAEQVRETLIDPLLASAERRERDLGRYLVRRLSQLVG